MKKKCIILHPIDSVFYFFFFFLSKQVFCFENIPSGNNLHEIIIENILITENIILRTFSVEIITGTSRKGF